jgi:molybdopterin/thiamine biosynthesis adenylyltransferase
MKENTKIRFKGAPWFLTEEEKLITPPILIGGAGGIGSWTTLFLTRAGYPVYVVDFDILEDVNLGGQFFLKENIGSSKVMALYYAVYQSCDTQISVEESMIDHDFVTKDPCIISAFDNMDARRVLFNKWKENSDREIFIDGRLSLEAFQIYVVTPGREEEYEKTLFEDSEVPDLPCTMKQTSHIAAMIATHITSLFLNYITNKRAGKEIRALPFYYEFFSPLYTI